MMFCLFQLFLLRSENSFLNLVVPTKSSSTCSDGININAERFWNISKEAERPVEAGKLWHMYLYVR